MSLTSMVFFGVAMAKGPPTTSLLKDKVDLNGDGKPDKVEVLSSDGQGGLKAVKVVVNGVSLADIQMYKELEVGFADPDTSDKAQMLLVKGTSESGKKWFTFFAWDGKKVLQSMKVDTGSPMGAMDMLDNGQVIVQMPRGFWTEHALWTLSGLKFEQQAQPFYAVGKPAVVQSNPVDLLFGPDSPSPVVTVGPGAVVTIVLCTTGDKPFYLVQTDTGLMGWVNAKDVPGELKPGEKTGTAEE